MIRITSVDYAPPELEAQTPIEARLLKKIKGTDRHPYYWTAVLSKPIRWLNQGRESEVTHVVVAARWLGMEIGLGMKQMPIGISYVIDSSVLDDSSLDVKKVAYVAIGVADEV